MCRMCGHNHSDFIFLEKKDPASYSEIRKDNPNARIIKSQSTTIRIPEF